MLEYNIGDSITIQTKEWYDQHIIECVDLYNPLELEICSFVVQMTSYCGQIAIITFVDIADDTYKLDIDNGEFWWFGSFFQSSL